MVSTAVTFNGITDAELAKILDFKAKHEDQVTLGMGAYGQPGTQYQDQRLHYNVVLTCKTDPTIKEALTFILTLLP